jgi:CelD/BcsL family acetyltransferase involved in cellulose biosynthesis
VFEIAVEKSFDFSSSEFGVLYEASCATAFQGPAWLDTLYRKLVVGADAEPLVITAREAGRLAMLLPLVRHRHGAVRVIEFADLQVSDYASPVCDEATFRRIANDAAAVDKIRHALKPYDVIWIRKLCQGSLPLEELLGCRSRLAMGMSSHAIALHEPYVQWRAERMDPSYRKELDKKERQLRRKGQVSFECSLSPETIKATFHRLREFRRARFEGDAGDLLQRSSYFDFYLDLAVQGASSGFSRTYTLSIDGQPIAGVFGLVHRAQFLVLLGGFDLSGYKNLSIGALMFQEIAKDCIDRGDALLDFTIGDESYKRLFGAEPSPMWMISSSGNAFGSVVNLVARQLPWVMKVAKGVISKPRLPESGAQEKPAASLQAP